MEIRKIEREDKNRKDNENMIGTLNKRIEEERNEKNGLLEKNKVVENNLQV